MPLPKHPAPHFGAFFILHNSVPKLHATQWLKIDRQHYRLISNREIGFEKLYFGGGFVKHAAIHLFLDTLVDVIRQSETNSVFRK